MRKSPLPLRDFEDEASPEGSASSESDPSSAIFMSKVEPEDVARDLVFPSDCRLFGGRMRRVIQFESTRRER